MKTKRFLSLTACLASAFLLTAVGLFADHHFQVERQFIYPDEFKPGKAYSPGVLVGETLYIAGQIDKDPQTGEQPDGIAAQTKMAMDNMGHVLRAAGMDYSNVVTCHVQLADMENYKEMNEVYARRFGDHRPARATVQTAALPSFCDVEIECIARVEN